jgi:hypothetical protein
MSFAGLLDIYRILVVSGRSFLLFYSNDFLVRITFICHLGVSSFCFIFVLYPFYSCFLGITSRQW